MDMTGLNRRNVLGAAGATMALAACGGKEGAAVGSDQICFDVPSGEERAGFLGKYPDNKLPNSSPVGSQKPINYKGSGFKPQHDFLVYLKFEGGKLKIRSAFFPIDPPGSPEDLAVIERRFAAIGAGAWPTGASAPSENFDGFGFGGQARVYFFVDNGTDVKFDDLHPIMMTMYKAKDASKKLLDKDNSFWNIQVRQGILSAENWYAYKNGDVIPPADKADLPPDERVEFSINVYLEMNCATTGTANYIPIVIDPDGTNGIKKP
jgi:hypothetical protein